jgi:hypothetical protein
MARKPPNKSAEQSNPFDAFQPAQFGSMVGMTQAWIDAMGALNAEVMTFVAARLSEDVHTQHAMMQAKDLKDIQHIQAEFFQKAIDQYQAETGKLVEMGSSILAAKTDET